MSLRLLGSMLSLIHQNIFVTRRPMIIIQCLHSESDTFWSGWQNNDDIRLLIETYKHAVRLHDIVVIGYNKFNREFDSMIACPSDLLLTLQSSPPLESWRLSKPYGTGEYWTWIFLIFMQVSYHSAICMYSSLPRDSMKLRLIVII